MGHNYFCNVTERVKYLRRNISLLALSVIVSLIWSAADYKATHIILSSSLSHTLLFVTPGQLYLTFTASHISLDEFTPHLLLSRLISSVYSALSDWPVPSAADHSLLVSVPLSPPDWASDPSFHQGWGVIRVWGSNWAGCKYSAVLHISFMAENTTLIFADVQI